MNRIQTLKDFNAKLAQVHAEAGLLPETVETLEQIEAAKITIAILQSRLNSLARQADMAKHAK